MNPLSRSTHDANEIGHPLSADDIEIKVLFSSDNPVLLGKTFRSQTVHVSRRKLSLDVCRELVVDSVLDMAVTLKDKGKRYHLTGNIRSCSPLAKPDHYHLDIVLRERADIPTDFNEWNRLFKTRFKHQT
jgi:hypothetical protein